MHGPWSTLRLLCDLVCLLCCQVCPWMAPVACRLGSHRIYVSDAVARCLDCAWTEELG